MLRPASRPTTRVTARILRIVPALLFAGLPLTLIGQSPAPHDSRSAWVDEVIKQESYASPPKELADAVLAPRYLNLALTNLSPDKKWFADEIGDGPVPMKTFAKPFHELGGVFIDFNRYVKNPAKPAGEQRRITTSSGNR